MAQQSGYLPGIAPPATDPELQQALQWSQRELDNISRQFTNFDTVQYNVLHAPPEKPRDGMTVVADGVNWNPGEGPGVYVYQNGAWTKVGGGAVPAFSVHKGGTIQSLTTGTLNLVTWSVGVYDIGGHFLAGTHWTPPAGLVHLSFGFLADAVTVTNIQYAIAGIGKNGADYRYLLGAGASALYGGSVISIDDRANGTDFYSATALVVNPGGSSNIRGDAIWTWFMGHWISP